MVVPSDDLAAMVGAIFELRARLETGKCFPPLTDTDRETLSWTAYGRRYADQIAGYFAQTGCTSRLRTNTSQKATRTPEPA